MEINLKEMTSKEYYFKDDVLCMDEAPYKTEDNYQKFLHPDDYKDVAENLTPEQMDALIKKGREYIFEARGKGKDDEYRWYIYTIHGMIPDEHHPYNVMLL